MQNKKISILFISKHAVHAKMAMAGNQFFYQTLLSFCQDERFQISILTVQKSGEDFQRMHATFRQYATDFSLTLPKIMTVFTYLFYHTKLRILLSLIRADWFLLDPIYRYYFKKAIKVAANNSYQPDVIVLEWTEVLFLLEFCKKLFPNAKVCVTEHDVSFTKLERRFKHSPLLAKKLVEPFTQLELNALSKMDLVRVLSTDDKNRLLNHGIKPENIRVVAPFFQKKDLLSCTNFKKQIVFYGALNRFENSEAVKWFIDNVYIPFKLSEKVDFLVVGGGNTKLKSQYVNFNGVYFTGYVDDPTALFVDALCMVVPLINGGGIKIKVLEAMTCSLPVLTNEIGMEGIGGIDGVQYIYCKVPRQYADGIDKLLKQPDLRLKIGNNAREWVNKYFNYEKDLENYKSELFRLNKT